MSAAARQRAYRRRRDNGMATFRLELNEVDTVEMLLAGGLLAERDAENRTKIAAALVRQIEILIVRSRDA